MRFGLIIIVALYLFASMHVVAEHSLARPVCETHSTSHALSHSHEYDDPSHDRDHRSDDHSHLDNFIKSRTISWANVLQQVASSPVILSQGGATKGSNPLSTRHFYPPQIPIFLTANSLLLWDFSSRRLKSSQPQSRWSGPLPRWKIPRNALHTDRNGNTNLCRKNFDKGQFMAQEPSIC